MSRSDDRSTARRPEPRSDRPQLSTRPVTISLDVAGSQFLASAGSKHATVAVFVESGATESELENLFEDLQLDLPIQARRLGVLAEERDSDPTDTDQEANSDE